MFYNNTVNGSFYLI